MLEKRIVEFEVGDDIQNFYLIKSLNIKTSSNHKKYLDLTLTDKTGEINSKLWDIDDESMKNFKPGDVVKVRGTVTSWQSSQQLKIVKMRGLEAGEDIAIEDLVQAAPIPRDAMFEEVLDYVSQMTQPDIKRIVSHIIEMNREKLMYYPAAKKNHHAIRSGLLYHILRMLRTAEVLCTVYEHLNKDLLYAGVILHDIEKINEMNADEMGVVSDYSFEGQILGHIIMGIRTIQTVGEQLQVNPEVSSILQHMILSHHYEADFGSPKKPMLPEAEMLHYLDMIDARVYDMSKALENVAPGGFTENIPVLDYRKLYKPKFLGGE